MGIVKNKVTIIRPLTNQNRLRNILQMLDIQNDLSRDARCGTSPKPFVLKCKRSRKRSIICGFAIRFMKLRFNKIYRTFFIKYTGHIDLALQVSENIGTSCKASHNKAARHIAKHKAHKVESRCLTGCVYANNAHYILRIERGSHRQREHIGEITFFIAQNAISGNKIKLQTLVLKQRDPINS